MGTIVEFKLVATRPEHAGAVSERASAPNPGIGPLNLPESKDDGRPPNADYGEIPPYHYDA